MGREAPEVPTAPLAGGNNLGSQAPLWSCCEPSRSRGLFIPGGCTPQSRPSRPSGSCGGRWPLGTATGLGGFRANGGSCSWQRRRRLGQLVCPFASSKVPPALLAPHLSILVGTVLLGRQPLPFSPPPHLGRLGWGSAAVVGGALSAGG